MAINNKNVTTRTKPNGVSDAAWQNLLATQTAAQLATYEVTQSVFCCNDAVQACADHDSDVSGFKTAKAALRAKIQATGIGSLTVADIAPLLFRLVNCIEKGMETS